MRRKGLKVDEGGEEGDPFLCLPSSFILPKNMGSIRLSLILYFLVLLLGTLGLVSVLVYQSAERSLQEKKVSMREAMQARYEERCREERAKLDEALLADARNLASLVKLRFQGINPRVQPLLSLGVLSAALAPQGHLHFPFWLGQGLKSKINYQVYQLSTSLKLRDMTLPPHFEDQVTEFFQINTLGGDQWQSPSMEGAEFAFDPNVFDSKKLIDWKFDDIDLEPHGKVRRVQLRVSRFRIFYPPWPGPVRRPPARPGFPGGKPPVNGPMKPAAPTTEPMLEPVPKAGEEHPGKIPVEGPVIIQPDPMAKAEGQPKVDPKGDNDPSRGFFAPPELTIFIQGACSTRPRDEKLAQFARELNQGMSELENDAHAQLGELRERLLLVAGLAFLATVVGGCLLVNAGLRPLVRLGEAVGKVSEKDFRLPLESKSLPVELQPIAERLHQTLAALQRAFAREKQAAADISHELRTPLAALMTMLDVGLKKPRPAEEYRELLEECRSAGQQMTQLVERLLALARLDAGSDHLRPRPVDVNQLAQQCAALVRPLAEARGVTLQVSQEGDGTLTTDADKLREVVINLLHNAIEYNKPNGRIDLSVERHNGVVEVAVHDTGVGIAPDARDLIFERFYRADASRRTSDNNLHAGIGLAIVKGYVELMGGRIQVESEVGVGSTFRVTLPVKQ